MRKILVVGVIIGIVLIFMTPVNRSQPKVKPPTADPTIVPTQGEKKNTSITRKSIFVPEWNLTDETILHNGYDRWIYFGAKEKLDLFKTVLQDKELWFTIKVDSLESLEKVKLAEYNIENIEGVVLDLEIGGLSSAKTLDLTNSNVKRIYEEAKSLNLKMALAMYGDLFYRKRPYDLKTLNQYTDEVMVMAYDFSKSYGEPGRNYPYNDFKKMVEDYLVDVPADKLTIIYGIYGYDWTMKDGKPLKPAESLSYFQIKRNFLGKVCYEASCKVITEWTKEKSVTYKGEDGYDHIVYFEDEESADLKSEYLKEKGIGSTAFWAWGYF